MRVQQRFGDAPRKKTDNDVPDEVKHIFPFESCGLEDGTQIIKWPVRSDAKIQPMVDKLP
jgi:hypothetical protein